MTANVLEHRRAKAFAEALEAHQETGSGGSHRSGSAAMAELLAIADSFGGLPEPELGAEARAVQRAQLMAAFEQEWAGGRPASVPRQRRHRAARIVPRRRWSRRLAIGGLIAGVAVGSFAGAAAASTNALPGDALYGMKRGLEGLRLDFAGSDSERGALLLEQATARLDEAQTLLQRAGTTDGLSPATVEQVRQALDDMHAEAVRGRDLLRSVYRSNGSMSPLKKLADFADEDSRWNAVHEKLPAGLTTQASRVDQLFDDISEDVAPFHLEKQPAQGAAPGVLGSGDGQQSPSAAANGGAQEGSQPGAAGTPGSRGANGASPHGGSSPSNGPGGVGGLVNNLTNGLTGGGTTPSPAQSGGAASPDASTSPTPDGQGLTIPPLIPGLLPGITLN